MYKRKRRTIRLYIENKHMLSFHIISRFYESSMKKSRIRQHDKDFDQFFYVFLG